MKRNGKVEFLRIIFALTIVIHHGIDFSPERSQGIMCGGAIATDFFFVLAGYFMTRKAFECICQNEMIGKETLHFIFNKIKRLMPNIYIAFLIAFILNHRDDLLAFSTSIDFIGAIWENTFLRMSGLVYGWENGVTWYISAMLLSMALIYPFILRYKSNFCYLAAPLGWAFIMGWLYQKYGCLNGIDTWNGFVFKGFLRGFAGVLGGCISYVIANGLKNIHFTHKARVILTIMENAMYLFILAWLRKNENTEIEFIIALMYIGALAITLSAVSVDFKLFQNRLVLWLGEFSLSLYLGHGAILDYIKINMPPALTYMQKLSLYIVCSVVSGLLLMYLSKGVSYWWNRNKTTIKKLIVVE